jgi:hypothetical protein
MKLMAIGQAHWKQGPDEESLEVQLHEGRSADAHSGPSLIRWDGSNCVRQLHLDLALNGGDIPPAARADHASHPSPEVLCPKRLPKLLSRRLPTAPNTTEEARNEFENWWT